MNKKVLAGFALLLLVLPLVNAFELRMLNEDGEDKLIYSPGEKIIFIADVEDDVDTVTLIVLKDNDPILTERMKMLSLDPKEFAYAYELPSDIEQGDYEVKFLAKGDETKTYKSELYIGQEIELEFIEKEPVEENLSFFQKLWRFIKSLF